jgi:hypothetical protein
MTIQELERALLAAQERLRQAIQTRVTDEHDRASAALLTLERELAAAKGEEYAVPLDFPIQWDTGTPSPHLMMNDHRAFLTFYVNELDDDSVEMLAVVEFNHCVSARMGAPNDEVFHGHPLYGKGFEFYAAQLVQNSAWLAQLETVNKVHRQYNPQRWQNLKHYIFWFHDKTFECIARSYKVETFRTTMSDLIVKVGKLLLE